MILLEDSIRGLIYHFPSLFKSNTYEESRIKALGHLLLCIGTGYEWHPDGYMYYDLGNKSLRKRLPKNYFDMQLYQIGLSKEHLKEVLDIIGNAFHYQTVRFHRKTIKLIFECKDKEKLQYIFNNFDVMHMNPREALAPEIYEPYPICNYSAVSEIFHGHTRSVHIDNFELVPAADWLQGAIEICQYALHYYQNPKLYVKKEAKQQIKFLKSFLDKFADGCYDLDEKIFKRLQNETSK